MTTDQMAADAMTRLAEFVNRSAAQHLRRMREAHLPVIDAKTQQPRRTRAIF